ncbi:MAG: hypothetical protein JNM74_08455 [Myxococcales bacterium]|nr:hypothetical protein [Myxococcales bacterium]
MRNRKSVFAVSAIGLCMAWAAGCATEVVAVDPPDDGVVDSSTPDTSKPDTGKPDTSTPDSGRDTGRPDTSTPDTSTPDAADAAPTTRPGDPVDPLAPKPGDMCPAGVQVNDVISRRCGKCGTQSALCEAGRIVGAYGACSNEKTAADACLPGEVLVSECGFCGYQVKRCDTTCSYTEGACLNQVAGGCAKGEVVYLEGLCTPVENVRKQTCSQACVKGAPEACAPRPLDALTVSQTAGTTVTGNFATTGTLKLPLLNTGTCPVTTSTTIQSHYHYLRINNTGADSVNVTISNAIPAGSSTRPAVTFAVYDGGTSPADRTACTGAVTTTSPERVTLNIPAGGSIIVHTMLDTSAATQSKLAIDVKTNFVGAEVAPVPDHVLTIGPNANDTVTQAVNFVNTKTTERPSTGTCPVSLSSSVVGYRYIRLENPSAADKLVDVSGDDPLDSVIAAYPGPDGPLSGARGNCLTTVNDFCPTAAGIATADSCLTGLTVPAMGSIVVYYSPYSTVTFGAATLRVTTKN